MIRPLRQRHRVMISTLSVIIPAAFALGISTRKEIPVAPSRPNASAAESGNYTELWNRNDLWEKISIRTRLLKSLSNPQGLAVELTSNKQIARPDLLVYWIPGQVPMSNSLPDSAFLLGSFDQSASILFPLPAQAIHQRGALMLYSLADHEIVAVSRSVTF